MLANVRWYSETRVALLSWVRSRAALVASACSLLAAPGAPAGIGVACNRLAKAEKSGAALPSALVTQVRFVSHASTVACHLLRLPVSVPDKLFSWSIAWFAVLTVLERLAAFAIRVASRTIPPTQMSAPSTTNTATRRLAAEVRVSRQPASRTSGRVAPYPPGASYPGGAPKTDPAVP